MDQSMMTGAMAGTMVAWWIIGILLLVVTCFIYNKAGKPWWAAIVPIYNIIVYLEIIGKPWWWLLLLLIPFVNVIIGIIMIHGLSKAFGHGVGFTLGLIFLGFIFMPVLAFGKSKYVGAPA
jgi:hypothetical protein